MTAGFTPQLYVDLGTLATSGGPQPTVGIRSDDQRLIYRSAVNVIFGPPESGKTLAASSIAADTLFDGGSVLIVDIDHNGPHATRQRFGSFGISVDTLSDPSKFRYAEPHDPEELARIIAEAKIWHPQLVLLDSIGELIPMYGGNSNDADDFTRINRLTLAAFAQTGAAVLAIDHEAKSASSRDYGSSGTAAKKRAVDGIMLRVRVTQPFTPGHGGRSMLTIVKDRHGALRRASPIGESEPIAASYQLIQRGEALDWKFWAPDGSGTNTRTSADAEALQALFPVPTGIRDIKDRMTWGTARAQSAWNAHKQSVPRSPGTQKNEEPASVPRSSPPIGGEQEHAHPQHNPETP
jgi:hypothetical protein